MGAIKPFTLYDFLEESNRIEGIAGVEPELHAAAEAFLATPEITRGMLVDLVKVAQPDAVLRDRPGLNVYVGNHVPPPGGPAIVDMLNSQIEWANAAVEARRGSVIAYSLHQSYETLHPFTDGNGRSGRILWLWMMGGIKRVPIGFLHAWYYASLQNARPPLLSPHEGGR